MWQPARNGVVAGDHEQADGAADFRPQVRGVDGPGEPLAPIAAELHLDDDAEHGLAVAEQDDEIGAVLGGLQLDEVRRLNARLGIGRKRDPESIAEQLWRQHRPIAEQQHQHLMKL